jgi:hypothetical protein
MLVFLSFFVFLDSFFVPLFEIFIFIQGCDVFMNSVGLFIMLGQRCFGFFPSFWCHSFSVPLFKIFIFIQG